MSNVTKHLSPLSYQSIKDEDIILITLRMLHHDIEEGIQSILEKLDKIMKVTLKNSAGDPEIPLLSVSQENESTHPPRAAFKRSTELSSQEPELGATQLSTNSMNEHMAAF